MVTIRDIRDKEFLLKGNASCSGCGATLAIRWLLKVLGEETVIVAPAGCIGVFQGMFPHSSFGLPFVDSAFGAQSSLAAGLISALKIRGKKTQVLTIAGDGGTADIGFHAVSAAAERNDDVLYVCYDNEAYMNTGVQRSGLTPFGAQTTTTPEGKSEWKKNLPLIMAAHKIPYVATASIGYPLDLMEKIENASKIKGFRYIHILTPCPPGWGADENKTVELGKLAVRTNIWPLFEINKGKLKLHRVSSKVPIKKYFETQKRFQGLSDEKLQLIQEKIDADYAYLNGLDKTLN